MITLLLRILLGAAGALGLLVGVRMWMDPVRVGAMMGLSGAGPLGQATLRADVGGFFAAVGVLALAGALRNQAKLFTAPMLMIALALSGRLVAAAVNGVDAMAIPSIVVEAVLVCLFALGRFRLGRT